MKSEKPSKEFNKGKKGSMRQDVVTKAFLRAIRRFLADKIALKPISTGEAKERSWKLGEYESWISGLLEENLQEARNDMKAFILNLIASRKIEHISSSHEMNLLSREFEALILFYNK